MTQHTLEDLWRDLPRAATEFEARFATKDVTERTGSWSTGAGSPARDLFAAAHGFWCKGYGTLWARGLAEIRRAEDAFEVRTCRRLHKLRSGGSVLDTHRVV